MSFQQKTLALAQQRVSDLTAGFDAYVSAFVKSNNSRQRHEHKCLEGRGQRNCRLRPQSAENSWRTARRGWMKGSD